MFVARPKIRFEFSDFGRLSEKSSGFFGCGRRDGAAMWKHRRCFHMSGSIRKNRRFFRICWPHGPRDAEGVVDTASKRLEGARPVTVHGSASASQEIGDSSGLDRGRCPRPPASTPRRLALRRGSCGYTMRNSGARFQHASWVLHAAQSRSLDSASQGTCERMATVRSAVSIWSRPFLSCVWVVAAIFRSICRDHFRVRDCNSLVLSAFCLIH